MYLVLSASAMRCGAAAAKTFQDTTSWRKKLGPPGWSAEKKSSEVNNRGGNYNSGRQTDRYSRTGYIELHVFLDSG